ncbi:hypothetical protein MMC25_007759 [Agyrium rufum]|nr:hypothetical protein [Agyrium rufum]
MCLRTYLMWIDCPTHPTSHFAGEGLFKGVLSRQQDGPTVQCYLTILRGYNEGIALPNDLTCENVTEISKIVVAACSPCGPTWTDRRADFIKNVYKSLKRHRDLYDLEGKFRAIQVGGTQRDEVGSSIAMKQEQPSAGPSTAQKQEPESDSSSIAIKKEGGESNSPPIAIKKKEEESDSSSIAMKKEEQQSNSPPVAIKQEDDE